MSYRYSVYGEIENSSVGTSEEKPDSVTVTNGTIDSGDITSVQTIDGTDLIVSESGKFEIAFTFSSVGGDPAFVDVFGHYDGNPAHNVFIEAWNYTGTPAWDRLTAASEDFNSTSADEAYHFEFPTDSSAYRSGSDEVQVRIRHDSSASAAHKFYTDAITVTTKYLDLTVAGTSYSLTGIGDGTAQGMTVNGSAGTMTIPDDGDYAVDLSCSFGGTPLAKIHCHVYIDGVKSGKLGFARTIGSSGAVGNAGFGGIHTFSQGEVVSIKFNCTNASAVFLTLDHIDLRIERK